MDYVRLLKAISVALVGIASFFAIIGVLGMGVSIASLGVFVVAVVSMVPDVTRRGKPVTVPANGLQRTERANEVLDDALDQAMRSRSCKSTMHETMVRVFHR